MAASVYGKIMQKNGCDYYPSTNHLRSECLKTPEAMLGGGGKGARDAHKSVATHIPRLGRLNYKLDI